MFVEPSTHKVPLGLMDHFASSPGNTPSPDDELGLTRDALTGSTNRRRRPKSNKQSARERRRRSARWRGFKQVGATLLSGFIALAGLLMVVRSLIAGDAGAFGFALMVLGLGVGPLGFQVAQTNDAAEDQAIHRSTPAARESFVLFVTIFVAACWAVGVGFMLFGYGPGQMIGGASKSLPVWIIAVLVWGGLAAGGVKILVDFIRGRRDK